MSSFMCNARMMILCCLLSCSSSNAFMHIVVWVGQSIESQRTKAAFTIGQVLLKQFGLMSDFPFHYVLGNELLFFSLCRNTQRWLHHLNNLGCLQMYHQLVQCLCLSKEYAQIHHWDFIKKHLDANREPPVYVIKTFNKYFSIPSQ